MRFGDIKEERMVGQMFWVPVSRHTGYWQVREGTAVSRIVDDMIRMLRCPPIVCRMQTCRPVRRLLLRIVTAR